MNRRSFFKWATATGSALFLPASVRPTRAWEFVEEEVTQPGLIDLGSTGEYLINVTCEFAASPPLTEVGVSVYAGNGDPKTSQLLGCGYPSRDGGEVNFITRARLVDETQIFTVVDGASYGAVVHAAGIRIQYQGPIRTEIVDSPGYELVD